MRLAAIKNGGPSTIESDVFELSQRELFGVLAGKLGIETITLLNRMRDYRCETLDIMPDAFIKATFTHTRYRCNSGRDVISTDKVSLIWEWDADQSKWVQLGVRREPIELRHHYHSEATFNAAAVEARAEGLIDALS